MAYEQEVNKERIYVTNLLDDTVSVISTVGNFVIDTDPTTSKIDPITVGDGPINIAIDPENKKMYVVNRNDGTISVIDTATNKVVETITVGNGLRGIAYDPENKRMYVGIFTGTYSLCN